MKDVHMLDAKRFQDKECHVSRFLTTSREMFYAAIAPENNSIF